MLTFFENSETQDLNKSLIWHLQNQVWYQDKDFYLPLTKSSYLHNKISDRQIRFYSLKMEAARICNWYVGVLWHHTIWLASHMTYSSLNFYHDTIEFEFLHLCRGSESSCFSLLFTYIPNHALQYFKKSRNNDKHWRRKGSLFHS